MNEKRIPSPQHAPVLALLELVTEHPELPPMSWNMMPTGSLSGALFDLPDVDAVLAAVTAVLGDGTVLRSEHEKTDGSRWRSVQVWAVWRDVRVHVVLGSVAQSVVAPSQVALGREVATAVTA